MLINGWQRTLKLRLGSHRLKTSPAGRHTAQACILAKAQGIHCDAACCRVQGAEHLLAALEGMGVDNARIEIEGGNEVPIIDGSALGWVIEIHRVCQQLSV